MNIRSDNSKLSKFVKFIIGFSIAFFSILVYSFAIEPQLFRANKQTHPSWPLKPIRVAFFSDLHMGAPFITESHVESIVNKINESNPDLILIGGDLVIQGIIGGTPVPIEVVASYLKKLRAPLGKFAVLGNHDWWNDGPKTTEVLNEAGIQVLENQSQKISLDSNSNFQLVGIGDHFTGHSDIDLAFEKIEDETPTIVFMHDPAALLSVKRKFNLAFAGHMHGGQVFIPGFGAIITPGKAPREWSKGWTDLPVGKLFVSSGIGTSILPVRFNTVPEFVILELTK